MHLNDAGLSTIVAQGNIGSNVGGRSKTYSVTANGTTLYFNGEGLTNSSNPNFTFKRGGTYFNMSTAGILLINTVQGTGTANAYASELK
jgi:hypothetical protein